MPDEKPGPRAVTCDNCGYEFPHQPGTRANPELAGASCPRCGSKSNTHNISLSATATGTPIMSKTVGKTLLATATGTATLSWERTRNFLEVNKGLIVLVAVIGVISSCIGLVIPGWLGALVSFFFTVLGFVVGLYAITRVREITRGGSD